MTSTLARKALVAFRKATFDLLRLAAKAHANAEAEIARLGGGKLGTLAHMALNRGRLRPLPSRTTIRDRLYGVAMRARAAWKVAEAACAEMESAIENANAAAGVQCDGGMPTWYASAIVAADGLITMAHDPDESLEDEIYIRCVAEEARSFNRERFERLVALAEQECVRASERPNGENTSKISHPQSAIANVDTPEEISWTDYASPKQWRRMYHEDTGIHLSERSWPRFKSKLRHQDHPQSGPILVRFAVDDAKRMGFRLK